MGLLHIYCGDGKGKNDSGARAGSPGGRRRNARAHNPAA